jgi:Septum formation
VRRLLALVLTVLVLSACTAGSPSASKSTPRHPSSATLATRAATAPAPPAAPPAAGCYRLSTDQLAEPANSSAPVPCSGPHTAATIYVGRLDMVVDGHAVGVDSAAVQRQLSTTCPRRLAAYVGGSGRTRALSRFNVVWYSPTLEQSDRGADWFRCDLIVFARADTLMSLPPTPRLAKVLDRPGSLGSYGLCGTAAPGARGFTRVVCARPHSWRAVDTIGIRGSGYPGTRVVRRAGDADCRDLAKSLAPRSVRFRYGWEWPTNEQWARGQHFGYCWVPS